MRQLTGKIFGGACHAGLLAKGQRPASDVLPGV
jgi:hypothetical protein